MSNTADSNGNGNSAGPTRRARIAQELQAEAAELTTHRDALREALTATDTELRDLNKVIRLLTGDTGPATTAKKPSKKTTSKASPATVERVRQAVMELAATGDGSFTQQAVIRHLDDGTTSGSVSLAFTELRRQDIVRFAGKDGVRHIFRLTRATEKTLEAAS